MIEAATKKTTSANSSVGPSFEEVEKMALSEKSCIPTDVHIVVLTLSRIFSGGYGKCQIANVKDYESKKSSLVQYGPMDTRQWYKMRFDFLTYLDTHLFKKDFSQHLWKGKFRRFLQFNNKGNFFFYFYF